MSFAKVLQPSAGQSRVASAVALLQQALDELAAARREEGAEHARRADALERDEAARLATARIRAARAPNMALIDKRRVQLFADAVMAAVRERSSVDQIESLLRTFVDEVEKTGPNG